MPQPQLKRGDRRRHCLAVLEELAGPNKNYAGVSLSDANALARRKFGTGVTDSVFYKERARLVRENPRQVVPAAPTPTVASLVEQRQQALQPPAPKRWNEFTAHFLSQYIEDVFRGTVVTRHIIRWKNGQLECKIGDDEALVDVDMQLVKRADFRQALILAYESFLQQKT
jgi:hypothetical protein